MPHPSFPIAGDLIAQARNEANIGTNVISSALQNVAMYQVLQDIDEEGVAYPSSIGVFGWPFLDTEIVINTVNNTTLNGAISKGATSMILTSGTDFNLGTDAIGAGYIRSATYVHDFFTFETGSGGTTLSGVLNIGENHLTAEEVHKIYLLPSNFGYPRALYRQSVFFQYQRVDESMRQIPAHPFYMIKYLAGTAASGSFLVLPYKIGVLDYTFLYQKRAVDLDNSTDQPNTKMSLPKGHGRRFYVEKLKAYIYENEGETDVQQLCESKALSALNKLVDEYNLLDMSGQQTNFFLSDW